MDKLRRQYLTIAALAVAFVLLFIYFWFCGYEPELCWCWL